MLQHLHIKGLALIDELKIDFADGFNVITGETGAGKSILIKALSLLFGDKAAPDIVRHGFEESQVAGIFSVEAGHAVVEKLDALGIDFDDSKNADLEIVLRRRVHIKGRSLAWINDVPVSLASLRDVSSTLMDVFGQHASHGLLNPGYHLRCLDAFLPAGDNKTKYQLLYRETSDIFQELAQVAEDYRRRSGDQDYLSFRFAELDEFKPSQKEYEHLLNVCRSTDKLLSKKKNLSTALDLLDSGHKGDALSKAVWGAIRQLDGIEQCKEISASLSEAGRLLDDASYELRRFFENEDVSEEDMEAYQARLGGYQSQLRRYSLSSVEQLLAKHEELRSELAFLDSAKETLEKLIDKLAKNTAELEKLAKTLTEERRNAFKKIKTTIEKELRQLAMPGACLEVEWSDAGQVLPAMDIDKIISAKARTKFVDAMEVLSGLGSDGAEKIHFLLQSNPGEPARALHKIASGGEMSRIMLALKKVLAIGAQTCVLVFDEIDTGISGEVADIVGQKISKLAKQFQVICISHLPQVSVYADAHFLVSKTRGARTQSSITLLTEKQSTEELARLLSGDKVTKSSLENAKALRAHADQLR